MENIEHSKFVTTSTGCRQYEIFLVMLIAGLSILARNFAVPWLFLGRKFNKDGSGVLMKFLIDFVIIVMPTLLSMTLLAESMRFLVLILCICVLTLLLFIVGEFYMMGQERQPLKAIWAKIIEEHHQPTTFVTFLRSMVLIFTGIAILAVDFPVFPRRFAKTESFGHSLMDVGVAAFVFLTAIAPHLKTATMREKSQQRYSGRLRFLYSSTAVLVYLGLVRTVFLTLLNYPQPVTEYGVHWNFFYTIAVLQFVSRILPSRFHLLIGTTFAVIHQTMLTSGYEEWIIEDVSPRDTLFSANREGICSLMGYLALFYISSVVGKSVANTGIRIRQWMQCVAKLLILSTVFFIMQRGSEMYLTGPSRRVVNVPYILSQLSLMTFSLAMCLMVQMISFIAWAARVPYFGTEDNPWSGVQPCMMDSVNRCGIGFFLICNVLTGLVNMSINTHETGDLLAFHILLIYMLIACSVATFFVRWYRKSSLKK